MGRYVVDSLYIVHLEVPQNFMLRVHARSQQWTELLYEDLHVAGIHGRDTNARPKQPQQRTRRCFMFKGSESVIENLRTTTVATNPALGGGGGGGEGGGGGFTSSSSSSCSCSCSCLSCSCSCSSSSSSSSSMEILNVSGGKRETYTHWSILTKL